VVDELLRMSPAQRPAAEALLQRPPLRQVLAAMAETHAGAPPQQPPQPPQPQPPQQPPQPQQPPAAAAFQPPRPQPPSLPAAPAGHGVPKPARFAHAIHEGPPAAPRVPAPAARAAAAAPVPAAHRPAVAAPAKAHIEAAKPPPAPPVPRRISADGGQVSEP
jgi:hypothetical protein